MYRAVAMTERRAGSPLSLNAPTADLHVVLIAARGAAATHFVNIAMTTTLRTHA